MRYSHFYLLISDLRLWLWEKEYHILVSQSTFSILEDIAPALSTSLLLLNLQKPILLVATHWLQDDGENGKMNEFHEGELFATLHLLQNNFINWKQCFCVNKVMVNKTSYKFINGGFSRRIAVGKTNLYPE